METYNLQPVTGTKSFYGKAKVERDDEGNETLLSYGTPIIRRTKDGKLVRLWYGWSATTGRHIAAFCGLNKAQYKSMRIGEEVEA